MNDGYTCNNCNNCSGSYCIYYRDWLNHTNVNEYCEGYIKRKLDT